MRDQRIVRNQKATRAATAAKSTPPPAILEKKNHLCLEISDLWSVLSIACCPLSGHVKN